MSTMYELDEDLMNEVNLAEAAKKIYVEGRYLFDDAEKIVKGTMFNRNQFAEICECSTNTLDEYIKKQKIVPMLQRESIKYFFQSQVGDFIIKRNKIVNPNRVIVLTNKKYESMEKAPWYKSILEYLKNNGADLKMLVKYPTYEMYMAGLYIIVASTIAKKNEFTEYETKEFINKFIKEVHINTQNTIFNEIRKNNILGGVTLDSLFDIVLTGQNIEVIINDKNVERSDIEEDEGTDGEKAVTSMEMKVNYINKEIRKPLKDFGLIPFADSIDLKKCYYNPEESRNEIYNLLVKNKDNAKEFYKHCKTTTSRVAAKPNRALLGRTMKKVLYEEANIGQPVIVTAATTNEVYVNYLISYIANRVFPTVYVEDFTDLNMMMQSFLLEQRRQKNINLILSVKE